MWLTLFCLYFQRPCFNIFDRSVNLTDNISNQVVLYLDKLTGEKYCFESNYPYNILLTFRWKLVWQAVLCKLANCPACKFIYIFFIYLFFLPDDAAYADECGPPSGASGKHHWHKRREIGNEGVSFYHTCYIWLWNLGYYLPRQIDRLWKVQDFTIFPILFHVNLKWLHSTNRIFSI